MMKFKRQILKYFRKNILFSFTALIFCILYLIFILHYFHPAITTPDANGYFVQARLIAESGITYLQPESILQYIGPHWHYSMLNQYFTTFPPGFPLILAFVYTIFTPKTVFLVNPILAAIVLFGFFLLSRFLFGNKWGLYSLIIIAVNPSFNEHALFGDSHISLVFFIIFSLYFLFKWIKTNSYLFALLSGLFIGVIPTIRYAEFLFCIAFEIFILINMFQKKINIKSFILFLSGAFIPIITLLIRNHNTYGAFWKTGFNLPDMPALFSFNNFISHFLPFNMILINEGYMFFIILGFIAIVFMIKNKKARNNGILFILLSIPIFLLYISYFWEPDPQLTRFLLPTFFIFTLSTTSLLKFIEKKKKRLSFSFASVILIITIIWGIPKSIHSMEQLKLHGKVLNTITDEIENKIKPGSIIITYEGINQNLDFYGSWFLIDCFVFKLIEPPPSNRHIDRECQSLDKILRNVELFEKYSNIDRNDLFNKFSVDVWNSTSKNVQIYLILKEEEIFFLKNNIYSDDEFIRISKIEIPDVVNQNNNRNSRSILPGRSQSGNSNIPMGTGQIFDLQLDGKSLYIFEWKKY